MALTRKLLKGMGLTEEQIDSVIDAHTETVDGLKTQIQTLKDDAGKLKDVQKELDDLKKAFRAMGKDRDFAIHVNNVSIVWDSYSDFENRIVKIRTYDKWNSYSETKMSWEKMKKYITQEVIK